MTEPVRLDWQLDLPTRSLTAAWAVFSDTDRFNRAANLGFSFREELDADGRRIKIGEVHRLGMTLTWEDDPFTYVAPRHFVSVRRFRNGPVARLETTMRLSPGADGAVLDYTILLFPRNAFARLLVQFDAWSSIRPGIGRTLQAAASQLGDAPVAYAPPPPLAPPAMSALSRVRDLPTGPALERTLREADLREQDRLRPRALASRWQADVDQVVQDLITAVGRGVLELRFDLICPRCQGPSNRRPVLDVRPTDLHCDSCGIAYDGSFPDSIEVSFRPAPGVRSFEVPLDCANSPAHGRHRLLREPLPAGAEVSVEIDVEPGAYRIDLDPAAGGASLEVREGLRDQHVAVDVVAEGIRPAILRVGPGRITLSVRSRLPHDVGLRVERRWRPEDVFTAGQLLERSDARTLLPDGALPPSLSLNGRRVGVLVIDGREVPDALDRATRRLTHGSTQSRTDGGRDDDPLASLTADGCWVGVYPTVAGALSAARSLVPAPRFAMVVHAGLATLVEDKRGVLPYGTAVDEAIALARRTGVGRLALHGPTLDKDLEVEQAVRGSGLPVRRIQGDDLVWLDTPIAPINIEAAAPTSVGGRYALSRELARGGMGIVHAAVDAHTGAEVVVKVLSPELTSEPSYAQRFFWEARIAARLDHANTVRVLDYGADGPFVWLVMEWLRGADLEHALQERHILPPREAVELGIQALEGLAAAHDQDVVHRDVKPANLFVCEPDSRVKVLDFGIAISVYDDLAEERGTVRGTPRYLSPEQVETHRLDARADVYAMSIVLYEMLSGRVPFEASGSRAMALIRLARDPMPLTEAAPDVPDALSAIVMRGLERDREARWPSARAMATALRAWLKTAA